MAAEPTLPISVEKNIDTGLSWKRMIVIGASAGGFNALKMLIQQLPVDFVPPIFVVWHMSPDVKGVLPEVFNRENKIYAANAIDSEPILPNRIYVAPPDHHLLVEAGRVRVTRGPKENRFRPAVDPLFRSAAYAFGKQVIGVILSGALNDGTAGLWTIKKYGGIAIVQHPADAEVSSMPEAAMQQVNVDYCVPVAEMASLLVRLSAEEPGNQSNNMQDAQTKREIEIAAGDKSFKNASLDFDALSPFTCPECHGVLSKLVNGDIIRYRCHTGHAYSIDALLSSMTERVEESLYSALRGMDETILLLNHMGDHLAEANQPGLAALYFQKAKEADRRSLAVREAILSHQQLTIGLLRQKADD